MTDHKPTEAKTLKVIMFYFFNFVVISVLSSQVEKYIPNGKIISGLAVLILPSFFTVFSLKKNNQYITTGTISKAMGFFSCFMIFMFALPVFIPDVEFDISVFDVIKMSALLLLGYTVPVGLFMIWLTKTNLLKYPNEKKVALESDLTSGAIYYLVGAVAVLAVVLLISWVILLTAQ